MTEQEKNEILAGLAPSTERRGAAGRLFGGLLNAPATAVSDSARAITNWFSDAPPESPEVPETLRPDAPQGWMETGADLVGAIAPAAIQLYLTGKAVSPVAGAAGLGPLATEVVKDTVGLGLLGSGTDKETGVAFAAEGAGYGLTSALPRLARIPISAAIAASMREYYNSKDSTEVAGGLTQGDIASGLGFAASFLPAQRGLLSKADDTFANLAKPTTETAETLALANRGEQLALADRALEGQIVEPFDAARMLRGGPNEMVDGVVNAGYTPDETALLNYFRTKPLELPAPRVASVDDLRSQVPDSSQPILVKDTTWNTPRLAVNESIDFSRGANRPTQTFANLAKTEESVDETKLLQYFKQEPLMLPEPRVAGMDDIAARIPKADQPIPATGLVNRMWDTPAAPIKETASGVDVRALNNRLTANAKVAAARLADNPEASPFRQKGKLRKGKSWNQSEGGFVMPELNAAIARLTAGAAIGAGIGASLDEGNSRDNLILHATTLGLAAAFGPALAGKALKVLSQSKLPPTPQNLSGFVKSWGQKVEDMAGKGSMLGSNPHVADRFVRMLDTQFGLTLSPEIKGILLKSRGAVDLHTAIIDSSMREVGMSFKPSPQLKSLTEAYMMNPANPAKFIQDASVLDPKGKDYANMIVAASESISALQRMAIKGIADPKQAAIMANSIGTYFTRSYKLFTSYWVPDNATIDRLVARMQADGVFPNASDATVRQHLSGYLTEAKLDKAAYGSLSPASQKINQAAFTHRKNMSREWMDFLGEIDNPVERILHTAFRLRPMAEAGENFANLAKLDIDGVSPAVFDSYGSLDAHRVKLNSELSNKAAQATNLRTQAASAAGTGNSSLASNLIAQADALDAERITLSRHVTSLDSYRQLGEGLSNGSLAGKVVSRGVLDSVKGVQDLMSAKHPFLRSMARFNSFIKTGRTLLNPVTMVRNYITSPAMAGIARVDLGQVPEAYAILKDVNHPMSKEIFEQGIMNADAVGGELLRDAAQLSGLNSNMYSNPLAAMLGMSKLDGGIASKAMSGIGAAYRLPDSIVRVASYLSAKQRFASKLNLPDTAPEVIEAARKFTERYTMNYSAVAPFVKTARNIPFTSLFLSYTAEMGRILKNLGEDVLKGSDGISHSRMYAAVPLGLMVAAPAMLASSSESNLSAKDRKDWEKTKSLMPQYAKDQNKIILGRNAKTGAFDYIDLSPLVPSDGYNKMFANLAKGDLAAAAESNPFMSMDNSPMLNMVGSLILGQDYRTHKEFRGWGDIAAMAAREVLPPLFPTGSEFTKMRTAYTENEDGGLGVTDKYGSRLTPSDVWLPYYTGLRVNQASLSKMQTIAVARTKNVIADEIGYLRKVLASDINADAKKQATERAKQAIKMAQATLRYQLVGDSENSGGN